MQSTCFATQGGPFNVAAVNLQTLPAVGSTGSQVDSGYPSYIMVPETYDDSSSDTSANAQASGGDTSAVEETSGEDGDGDGNGDGVGYPGVG